MKHAVLERQLLRRLAVDMPRFGFDPKPVRQTFYRSRPFGWWAFHIAFIPHDADVDVTADVAVRVDQVEELVNTDNNLLSAKERAETATIGAELGNIADHRQKRWTIAREEDIEQAARPLLDEFEKFGLPYLERFSDLETLLATLSDNGPAGWLHSAIHASRCKSAVALAFILGKKEGARELLRACDDFLSARRDPGLTSFRQFASKLTQAT